MNNNQRPPIPSELKRRVLLEAGHRCAIPTCKFPDVDVHHIVPWSKCREHQFNNLIALCPNCHRRAHNGEIDRQSLLIYKSRLIAIFGKEMLKQSVEVPKTKIWLKSSYGNYLAAVYEEVDDEAKYYISIEYPKFASSESQFINEEIEKRIIEISKLYIDEAKSPDRITQLQYFVKGSYYIGLNTPLIISLKSNLSAYGGGAHGSAWTEVFNYRLDLMTSIHIEDLFQVPKLGIEALSDFTIQAIMKLQSFRDIENVNRGAGPESKNYEKYNLTPEGLLVAFDEYRLGCYAEGPAEILVPYSALRPYASDFLEHTLHEYGEHLLNDPNQ